MARRASKPAQASWGDPPRTRSATLMNHTASPPVKTSSILELRCRQIVVKRMGRQSFKSHISSHLTCKRGLSRKGDRRSSNPRPSLEPQSADIRFRVLPDVAESDAPIFKVEPLTFSAMLLGTPVLLAGMPQQS